MQLRFLGKESAGGDSPTLYASDRDTYVVQGWKVEDEAIVSGLDIPSDEACVEVPPRLLTYLGNDGVHGQVASLTMPIVHVTAGGNYIIQGSRVHDGDALAQMRIPEYESCVEIPKLAIHAILEDHNGGADHK